MFFYLRCAALLVLSGLTMACYWIGLDSPLVFDDVRFFSKGAAFDYAIDPNFAATRTLPYFSIGLLHVLSGGDLFWNRVGSLVLHCLVAISLYFFIKRATTSVATEHQVGGLTGLVVVLWFLLNPVAVYGSGYLVQRTIVMATLFGLISATLYLRAQQEKRNADVFSSVLLGLLAMMSKEHAVLMPVAILMLTPLVVGWTRAVVARAAVFFMLSLPCMVWTMKGLAVDVVGTSYEVYSGQVLTQMVLPEFAQTKLGLWLMSIGTQILLFWKYFCLWFLPNPDWMSADMRVDFPGMWADWYPWFGLTLSMVALVGVLWLWLQHRGASFAGRLASAILYVAVLFSIELSVVRVQEPFVLYRSFLWMPGYALTLALLLQQLDLWVVGRGVLWRRGLWAVALLACLGLFPLAQDRLRSFSSDEALWRDAEAKLPRPDVAGADRIYYNLAGEAFKRKDYASALTYSDKVIRQNPEAFQGYLARGSVLLAQRDVDGALQAFDAADAHQPPKEFRGYIEFKRCGAYSVLGDKDGTIACLRRSAQLGYEGAKLHLQMAGLAE